MSFGTGASFPFEVLLRLNDQFSNPAKRADSSFRKFSKGISSFGKRMSVGFSLPVLAGAGAAFQLASEMDQVTRIAAQNITGSGSEEEFAKNLRLIETSAKGIAKEVPQTYLDIARAMQEASKSAETFSEVQILADVGSKAATLAGEDIVSIMATLDAPPRHSNYRPRRTSGNLPTRFS